MDHAIAAAADALRATIAAKVEEVKANPTMAEILRHHMALNSLEDVMGRPKTSLASLFALESSAGGAAPAISFPPDEFVNLPALDAAKRFLRKVGKPARPFADIVKGIRAGGGVVNYEDKLRAQLVRSNDVKKVGDDLWGLMEWYPARKGRPPAEANGKSQVRSANLVEAVDEAPEDDVLEEENASPAANE